MIHVNEIIYLQRTRADRDGRVGKRPVRGNAHRPRSKRRAARKRDTRRIRECGRRRAICVRLRHGGDRLPAERNASSGGVPEIFGPSAFLERASHALPLARPNPAASATREVTPRLRSIRRGKTMIIYHRGAAFQPSATRVGNAFVATGLDPRRRRLCNLSGTTGRIREQGRSARFCGAMRDRLHRRRRTACAAVPADLTSNS